MIGIVVELFSFVPSVLLVQFFRRIQTRKKRGGDGREKAKRKKRQCDVVFPWWCLYVAYGVSLMMVGGSILLTVARGIELGDRRIQQWLKSLVISFISSVCLTQPLKVIHRSTWSSENEVEWCDVFRSYPWQCFSLLFVLDMMLKTKMKNWINISMKEKPWHCVRMLIISRLSRFVFC